MNMQLDHKWRHIILAGLLTAAPITTLAIPIDVVFGDVLVSGQSETTIAEPSCPLATTCDFRPGARVFRATVAISQRVQTPNPIEINLIDEFFTPDAETMELWEEISTKAKIRKNVILKLMKTRSRELRAKRRPPQRGRIVVPDNDIDPFLLTFEYDANAGVSPYLTLNVLDTVTGEFSDTRIQLVPEPSILPLMGIGLLGIFTASRRKKSQS